MIPNQTRVTTGMRPQRRSVALTGAFFFMKRLNNLDLDPLGGWRWKCEVNELTLKAGLFIELLLKVNSYLRANGIPLPGDRGMVTGCRLPSERMGS